MARQGGAVARRAVSHPAAAKHPARQQQQQGPGRCRSPAEYTELFEDRDPFDLTSRSRCVLCAVSRFARGLPQFAAMSNAGLAWAPLAKSVSVRQHVPPAAAVAAQATAAGKRQARQGDAAAVADIGPPSAAPDGGLMSATGAAHEPSQPLPAASTATSLDSVGAKRPAEAEAARSGK